MKKTVQGHGGENLYAQDHQKKRKEKKKKNWKFLFEWLRDLFSSLSSSFIFYPMGVEGFLVMRVCSVYTVADWRLLEKYSKICSVYDA